MNPFIFGSAYESTLSIHGFWLQIRSILDPCFQVRSDFSFLCLWMFMLESDDCIFPFLFPVLDFDFRFFWFLQSLPDVQSSLPQNIRYVYDICDWKCFVLVRGKGLRQLCFTAGFLSTFDFFTPKLVELQFAFLVSWTPFLASILLSIGSVWK